ncbi:DUF6907 domain-containing protein [Micromonospora mirobrigensis]|uniref:Uncharacterized protein n=1 Tax=Micromonospora mirobrigensis TaxID=262898 RepID=A0A1C4YPG2_9ACTN|nr:hypothetical protein [Micromonospora mirobrigensis]SCF22517.1 hypothetical protein GA0070564_104255 [Micromonospora mirobrigensis]
MTIIASAPVPPASRLDDADTTDLRSIPRPRPAADLLDDRYAAGYADGLHRAFTASRPVITDAELIELATHHNPAGVHELARAITAGCPAWCTEDHRGQVTEQDGFSIGLVHERVLVELTAQDPSWSAEHAATATVYVEATTERGEVTTAPRVVLTVAEDDQGHWHGSENTEGWTGTPAEARRLAAALLAAAELVDGSAR